MGSYLNGTIPRIEPKAEQVAVASLADAVEAMMLDLRYVQRFEQMEIDLAELDVEIILTSTIPDEELEEWFPERELAAARRIGASAIIPCDRPVYDVDARSRRIETIRAYAADLLDIVPQFREFGIDVVPLVKGESEYERGLCYDAFDELGCSRVAYYCVQYFTYGYRYSALLERIQRISFEYNPNNMMLIGFQSENRVSGFPPCVSGVAGQRWLRKSNPRTVSVEEAVQSYDRWSQQVESALCTGQAPLQAFESGTGWA